jgi:hypothetical protein
MPTFDCTSVGISKRGVSGCPHARVHPDVTIADVYMSSGETDCPPAWG